MDQLEQTGSSELTATPSISIIFVVFGILCNIGAEIVVLMQFSDWVEFAWKWGFRIATAISIGLVISINWKSGTTKAKAYWKSLFSKKKS